MVDSTAVYVSADIELARIATEGVVFYPGVRLTGAETLVCPNTTLGELGGVVLHDVAVGPGARVQRGSAEHSTLLAGAVLGPDAHVRSGTILEEGASTAHAVGLKQTLIAAYACIGSNVNMCDCYLGGGRSSSDHSEVGSGFIHFNFSPFGASGDKASASIFGPVPAEATIAV